MPLYEYECNACHKHTEKIQKFSDPEITACPYCGGELKRVLSAPGFAFKGGGWYADGYGSAKPAPAEGSSSADKPADSTSSDKPAAPAAASESAPAASAPPAAPAAASAKPASGNK